MCVCERKIEIIISSTGRCRICWSRTLWISSSRVLYALRDEWYVQVSNRKQKLPGLSGHMMMIDFFEQRPNHILPSSSSSSRDNPPSFYLQQLEIILLAPTRWTLEPPFSSVLTFRPLSYSTIVTLDKYLGIGNFRNLRVFFLHHLNAKRFVAFLSFTLT